MPSAIVDRILADIKTAMKAQDKPRLEALRLLHSEIKNVGINERRELTDDDAITVIGRAIKARQDSIEQFRKGGRQDLVDAEELQIAIYRAYQPAQLDDAALAALVDEAVAASGAKTAKDIGAVMKVLMPKVKGKADGKAVNAAVMRRLQG